MGPLYETCMYGSGASRRCLGKAFKKFVKFDCVSFKNKSIFALIRFDELFTDAIFHCRLLKTPYAKTEHLKDGAIEPLSLRVVTDCRVQA